MYLLSTYLDQLPVDRSPSAPSIAGKFCAWLGARAPTKELVSEWLARRRAEGYASGTLALEFSVIRRIFKVNGLGWPFRRGEGPQISERDQWRPILSEALVARLIRTSAAMQPAHQAHLAMATTYGLRRVELVELGPHSFDYGGRAVYVATAKRGRQRYHAIPEPILPVLRAYTWPPRTALMVSAIFAELKQAARLTRQQDEDVGYHAIRRSLTRALAQGGMNDVERRTFLRWKLTSMEDRYTSGVIIGEEDEVVALGSKDADLDAAAFSLNPWLSVWEEVAQRYEQGA